jgi:hypothetical protein
MQVSKGGPPDIDGENTVFFPCGAWFSKEAGLTKTLKPTKMSPEEGEVELFLMCDCDMCLHFSSRWLYFLV